MALVQKHSKKDLAVYSNNYSEVYTRQAAHDIRSPLSVINLITETYKHLVPPEATDLMRTAVQRINDIANELLIKEQKALHEGLTNECLKSLVEEILDEKIALYPKTEFKIIANDEECFTALVNKCQFQRALSNVINNSLESEGVVCPLEIIIELRADSEFIEVTCIDNGKGIPEEVLEKVGSVGFSHGKTDSKVSGTGLGVHQAKSAIESIGGHFEISSIVGEGTCVSFLILR